MQAYVRLAVVMLVTTIIGGGLYFGADQGWGRVEQVSVTLASTSDQGELFARIEPSLTKMLEVYDGQWLWRLQLEDVTQTVLKDRRIRSVEISRLFPNRLEVNINPHRPTIAWVDEVGRFFPVALDGTLLPPLPSPEAADVPLLRGRRFQADQSLRERALALFAELPDVGALAKSHIAEITHSDRSGFGLLLIQGGMEVRLGEGQIGLKASRVDRVLNYLQDQQLRGRVIDARFGKKVVVRLRNDP